MTSFINISDVKRAEKRYACLKIVNNKTKMNISSVSYHRCLGSPVVRKKEFRLKGFISLEEIIFLGNKKCHKHLTNAPKGIGLA